MQTYENKGADVYTNGSAGHINGAELTRMKEVAFEKNPSEPMVRHLLPHTHTHTRTHLIFLHIRVAGSSSLTDCVVSVCRGSLWSSTTNKSAPWPEYCTGAWSIDKVINRALIRVFLLTLCVCVCVWQFRDCSLSLCFILTGIKRGKTGNRLSVVSLALHTSLHLHRISVGQIGNYKVEKQHILFYFDLLREFC